MYLWESFSFLLSNKHHLYLKHSTKKQKNKNKNTTPKTKKLRNIIAKFDRINIANFFYIFNMLLNVLTEEILWRGFVLTFLSKKSNNFFAIFITSVFFGLMHFPVTYSFTQVINTCINSI